MPDSTRYLVNPASDRLVVAPLVADPNYWAGAPDLQSVGPHLYMTYRLRGPEPGPRARGAAPTVLAPVLPGTEGRRGDRGVVTRFDGRGYNHVFSFGAEAVPNLHSTGTRSLERLTVTRIGGLFHVIYSALDDTAEGVPDRWSLWEVTAPSFKALDIGTARRINEGSGWASVNRELAGGVKDPTVIEWGGHVNLMFVGWKGATGPASTFRAIWDHTAGWIPRGDRPITPAGGVAAAEARYTGGVRLSDGWLSVYDVAATREQNTRETSVLLRGNRDPFADVEFGDQLPPTLAAPGISARYATVASHGDQVHILYEVPLRGSYRGAHGTREAVYAREQFHQLLF